MCYTAGCYYNLWQKQDIIRNRMCFCHIHTHMTCHNNMHCIAMVQTQSTLQLKLFNSFLKGPVPTHTHPPYGVTLHFKLTAYENITIISINS